MVESPLQHADPIDRRTTREYWNGQLPGDVRPAEMIQIETDVLKAAWNKTNAHLHQAKNGDSLSRFPEGNLFDSNRFPRETVVSLDIESLRESEDYRHEKNVTYNRNRYWGAVVPLSLRKSDAPLVVVYFPQRPTLPDPHGYMTDVTLDQDRFRVLPSEHRIGEIMHEEGGFITGGSIHRVRSIDVHSLGEPPVKKRKRELWTPRIFAPLWNPLGNT